MAGTIWTPKTGIVKGRTNVFIFDWRDNPAKDEAWYEARRSKAEQDGLMHVFEQEVNRNYAASVEGIIIPAIWVRACFDAHKKIAGMEDGPWTAGFDPYDEGRDRHALVKAKGVVIKYADDWTEGNTGDATRKVVIECRRHGSIDVNFDASGVGAGVKSEAERLSIMKEMPSGMRFIAWNGGAGVLNPESRVDDDIFSDMDTGIAPRNKEMFANMKAQAWWSLRRRCEKTWRAMTMDETYPPDELISIDTENIPADKLAELERQLSQPTRKKKTGTLKLVVDKAPEGSSSPNLGDGAVMALFPVNSGYIYDLSKSL
jgi:phage terminase large subunit